MLALLLVFLLLPLSVLAQPTSDLYLVQNSHGNEYRAAFNAFQLAKNQHIQYNTGTTRVAAMSKANEVLGKRNTWQSDYLRYLRSTLADSTNIANYAQTVVYLDLENEISALQELQSTLVSGTDFAQINTASKNWEKRAEASRRLIDAAVLQIAVSRLEKLQIELVKLVDEYRTAHPILTSNEETTLNLINQKIETAQSTKDSVNSAISSYKSSFWTKNTQIEQLKKSRILLIEAAELLSELSRQL